MRRLLTSRLFVAAVALLIGAGAVGAVWAITDEDEEGKVGGEVRVVFEPGPRHQVDLIQRSSLFQRAADTVNDEVNLPRDLTVKVIGERTAARVGVSGPTYEPSEHTIYFPWSFVEESHADLDLLKSVSAEEVDRIANIRHRLTEGEEDRLLQDAMLFVLYHEIGHGLFDVLDVPVVGGEESTADSLAGIFAVAHGEGGQRITLAGGALELMRGERSGGDPSLSEYADDHGFDKARAFNALCLVYGSSPPDHRNLVGGPGDLTEQRAELCPFEYRGDLRSWRRLLSRWLTEKGGLLPLKD